MSSLRGPRGEIFLNGRKCFAFSEQLGFFPILSSFFGFDFPCGSASKESTCNAEDLGSIPGLGRSPGEGKGYPLQYSSLENSMDYTVHGVTKSQTQLSDFHFGFTFMDTVRPRANQRLSLAVATGKFRPKVCSISHT